VGISKRINGEAVLINNPTNDHSIDKGDYAIILGNPRGKDLVTEVFGVEEGI
jgi:hypothetical protein